MTTRKRGTATGDGELASPHALVAVWRERAAMLHEWAGSAAEGVAHAYEEAARELESALATQADDLLTLPEAAALTGYSADHLGRLVRTGQLANYGRPHAPRVRRGELPVKRGYQERDARGTYDPVRDAASIRARFGLPRKRR